MEQLAEVEALCRKLFESRDPAERAAADRALQCFATPEYFLHSRFLLENSSSPYVLLLASSSLTKVVSAHWTRFLPAQRAELRAIVQRRLLSLDANATPPYALQGVVTLYARLIKLTCLDTAVQGIIAEILERFLGVPAARATGLQILIQLIADMNQAPPPVMTATQNRKVSMQFRDGSLLQIFEMALVSLSQLSGGTGNAFGDDDRLCDLCLQLLNKCLSFDFLGTQPDERTEDVGTVQVPTSWRGLIEDPKTTDLLFKLYMSTANNGPVAQSAATPRSAQALESLIQLASVRRSLFSTDDHRDKFLARLIAGISKILSTQTGLQNATNHHELSRLMMRFRSNFQLPQMIAADGYPEFISLASQFTVSSFRAWPYASRDSSHFYLLSFWSRIAAANTYVRSGGPPSLLENFVPKVAEAYITSRLELVALILQNPTIEDPLDDEEQLEEQLEQLPQLGRCKFTETSAFLLTAFDPLAQAFEKFIAAGNASPQAQLVELQLTWLTYLIASILGGRLEAGASEEHDPVDGLLASRIFRLLILSDSRTTPRPSPAHEKLERAVLFFLQQFRRVFIGEQAMSSSKVYGRLAEDLGLGDHLHVLNFMINKIGTNLKRWGREPRIIEKTLCLFQDLASGYSSGKLLAQLEGINQLLTHHTSEYFPFLDLDENLRSRTVYYNTLAKLFLAMDDNAVRFRAFMEPFRTAFLAIGAQLHDPSVARQPLAQRRLIGLLRDLRGIADACVSRRSHTLLFDWLHPTFTAILTQVAQVYADFPSVTTPLLKLYAELVHNKQCRLNFDCSSANGILLFRELSRVICAYGGPTLQRAVGTDPYAEKYKGIWLCMLALTRTFSGNYVCFGVFALYKDPSLTDALSVVLKLATSIPLADGVLHYPKVCRAFFNLMEALTEHHMPMLAEVDTATLVHITFALKEALRHVDQGISNLACLALDNLASYHHRSVKDGAAGLTLHFASQPDLLPTLLLAMMNLMLFDESANQHCLSRPIFSVICIAPAAWTAVQEELYSRNAEHRAELAEALSQLMQEVQPVLDSRNRDKFASNLGHFRQSVKHWIV